MAQMKNVLKDFVYENIYLQLHGHDWINEPNIQNISIARRRLHFAIWLPFYFYFFCDTFLGLVWRHNFDLDSYLSTMEYLAHKAHPEKLWLNLDVCYATAIINAFIGLINLIRNPRSSSRIALVKYDSSRIFCTYRQIWIAPETAETMLKFQNTYRKWNVRILSFISVVMGLSIMFRIEAFTALNIFLYFF